MNDLTLVVPAYNEEETLESFIPALLEFCHTNGCKIILVNDGSNDGTKKILEKYENTPLMTQMHHKVNRGYGGAIKSGISMVDTTYIMTIDADGQHQLKDVIALYQVMCSENADMVIGNRKKNEESLCRKIGKAIIRFIASKLMPFHIYDLNSGMKIYRTKLVLEFMQFCPDNMAFSDIITLVFINQRCLVLEHPITTIPRRSGKSTINVRTAFDTIMEILHIAAIFNPRKLFLMPSILFLTAGAVWETAVWLRGESFSVGALLVCITGLTFFFLGVIAEQLALLHRKLCQLISNAIHPDL